MKLVKLLLGAAHHFAYNRNIHTVEGELVALGYQGGNEGDNAR